MCKKLSKNLPANFQFMNWKFPVHELKFGHSYTIHVDAVDIVAVLCPINDVPNYYTHYSLVHTPVWPI